MDKIKNMEHLRLQKELLQLQQMIGELRMRKEIHVIRRKMGITNILFPTVKQLLKTGIKTRIGKQLLSSTASVVAKKLFKKKSR